MATLWIREYGAGGALPVPVEPGIQDQTVTFTTTTASAKFSDSTRFVTIIGSAAFHYQVAASPTATTSNIKVPADTLVSFAVTPGHKVAAVTAS